jgi:hypothetical protein
MTLAGPMILGQMENARDLEAARLKRNAFFHRTFSRLKSRSTLCRRCARLK